MTWAGYWDALLQFLLLNWALQATLILTAGLLLARLPRLRASMAHGILAASLVLALAAPVLRAVPPRRPAAARRAVAPARRGTVIRVGHAPASAPRPARAVSFGWALGALWLSGVVLRLGWLAGGLWSVRRMLRATRPLPFDAGDVEVLEAPAVAVPSVVGVRRPRVLVPVGLVEQLDPETLRAVLLHEEAHALRRDPLWLVVAAFCHAFLWWNPLAALARRRMELAAEDACDAYVLSQGVAGPRYARTLVSVLERASAARRPALACLLGVGPASGVTAELRRRVVRILAGAPRTSPAAAAAASLALAGAVGACAVTEVGAPPARPVRLVRFAPHVGQVAEVVARPLPPLEVKRPLTLESRAPRFQAARETAPEPAPAAPVREAPLPVSEPVPPQGPVLASARARPPQEGRCVVFVLDVSSSMRPHLPAARARIMDWVRELSPADTFNVVAFASDLAWYAGTPVSPSLGTVAGVQSWMESLPDKTGTNLPLGLHAALEIPHVSRVVIVSDGEPWRWDAGRVGLAAQVERENPYGAAVEQWEVGAAPGPAPEPSLAPARKAPARSTTEAGEKPVIEP